MDALLRRLFAAGVASDVPLAGALLARSLADVARQHRKGEDR
jgi:hypothetical protein